MIKGVVASSGIAIGTAVVLDEKITIPRYPLKPEEVEAACSRYYSARDTVLRQLEQTREKVRQEIGEEESMVFEGHMLLLDDEEFEAEVTDKIRQGQNVEAALMDSVAENVLQMKSLQDAYMAERAGDLEDVGQQVLHQLTGYEPRDLSGLPENSIIVASDLTPSQTSRFNYDRVKGFITATGGVTAHTAIMARALELPALVGCGQCIRNIQEGDELILDAVANRIMIHPDTAQRTQAENLLESLQQQRRERLEWAEKPLQTADGKRTEVCANIGTLQDMRAAQPHAPQGVGLFRTEFLFMDRSRMPGEQEQFQVYRDVVEMQPEGGATIIRTLDIGGDKAVPYLPFQEEDNPFLGWRGVRMYRDLPDLIRTQLRAVFRASAYGSVRIMVPMVISLEEVRWMKQCMAEVAADLDRSGIAYDAGIELGIMIETPAAVMLAEELAEEVAFFSIGTNDLTQYLLAVDRGNQKISYLYDSFSPVMFRAVDRIVRAAHRAGIWVGVCGELAGDADAAMILAGLGVDELSMSAARIPDVKKRFAGFDSEALVALSADILGVVSSAEVRELIKRHIA